jgi:hypothetical protein
LRHRAFAAGFAAVAAVVVVSGTAMALGPATWHKPPEPSGTPLPPPATSAEAYDSRISVGQSLTLSGPMPTAAEIPAAGPSSPLAGPSSPLAGPTPPITAVSATPPTPAPQPTPIPDTVANARAFVRAHLDARQFSCVDILWQSESRWNPRAVNLTTGAYGIPQSYPAAKMAAAGRNWRTSPRTQVSWGLQYIALRYGTACAAWSFRLAHGWY